MPLTTSLYVPGLLSDTQNVLVDVGTGFYVEKSVKEAEGFYRGKVGELGGSLKELEKILEGKSRNLRVVEEVLREKMAAEQAQGAQGQGGAAANGKAEG